MSDATTNTQTGGNGAAASTSRQKRKIATSRYEGHVGRIEFSSDLGGHVVEIDGTKIHPSIKDTVTAYGAVNIMQTAYNTSDDPVGAARAMARRLQSGDWKPGLPRREAEPDVLMQALAQHLQKPVDWVETIWLPAYGKKHGLDTGPAKRQLRAHKTIAGVIAEITAKRAAEAAAAAKRAPAESLDLSV